MSTRLARRKRRWTTFAFVLVCAAALALMRAPEAASPNAPEAPDALVFAFEVQSADGRVIASPVVLGAPGQSVTVRLMCEHYPELERLSITLDPQESTSQSLLYSYELSVAGRLHKERGTVALSPGDERRIDVLPRDRERGVTLGVYAAPVGHPGIESFLQERRVRLARTSS